MKEILSDLWEHNPTFFSNVIAALIALLVAVVTIRKNRQTSREKNSLDFESSYKRSDKVDAAWQIILTLLKKNAKKPMQHWGQNSVRQTQEARALMTVFNEWERCGNAIKHGLFDEGFLYKVYASTVINLYIGCKPYIDARQKVNPRIYTNFCWLANRWIVRKRRESLKGELALPFNIPFPKEKGRH
ncbi:MULTISPECIES: DUF4760 domain-containing protein [Serratia]|uniref:DUF4760 domain-containing protein n=1 Tax=Serratia TaxID=613 RepID=UPI0013DB014E|nr:MULTISPECIES: DUF4760 domain-containing protein [Serratia]